MRNYKTPLFQHRHYEWLAEALARIEATPVQVSIFVSLLNAGTNPQFQVERFRAAVEKHAREESYIKRVLDCTSDPAE